MNKLYLVRNPETARDLVHGVDYDKGLEGRECGIKHEFQTRECQPIFLTEAEKDQWYEGAELVEITPFREEIEGEVVDEDVS